MMEISLTAGMRSNLTSLQQTADLLNTTQSRLSTGKKVNSALDNPVNYFAALAHTTRANDLSALKDDMGEAIQTVKAANAGITAITSLIEQAKSVANSAKATTDTASRTAYIDQYDALRDQIDNVVANSGYKGVNFLADNTLTVAFDESATSTLDIVGFDATVGGDLAITAANTGWDAAAGATLTTAEVTTANALIDADIALLNAAKNTLKSSSAALSSSLSVVSTRQAFTSEMVNTLVSGANNLTLADLNEEGANMLALQTRQALSTTSLRLSSEAAQSVLRLF
jgi:flagellin-like hook-associated protein FlgL